jgi:hypothetical protein
MEIQWESSKIRVTRARKKKKGIDPQKAEEARREEEQRNLETLEFMQAIYRFKRQTRKAFPSWSEVLEILRSLGYRKVME